MIPRPDTEPVASCSTCARELREDELTTCKPCVGRARADLHAITNTYALLPATLTVGAMGSNAPRRDAGQASEPRLVGGDPLTLLGPGSDGRAALRRLREADLRAAATGRPHSEPPWGADDRPDDPVSVAHELGRWEDDWRRVRGEPGADGPAYVATATAYLLARLPWAAGHHDAFPDFVADLRALRARLESVTRTDDRPERAGVTCFEHVRPLPVARCGGQLVRQWRAPQGGHRPDRLGRDTEGREDDATCLSCGRTYSAAAYWLAVRASLEGKPADETVATTTTGEAS